LTPEQLSKQVPTATALVDLIEYFHFRPPKAGKGKPQSEQRLLAFVVRRGQEPVVVSLGTMKPIEQAVARWRSEVQKVPARANREAIDRAARTLRQRVWQPLSKHLGGVKTVLVAADGVLCQFPLAALPGSKKDSFLIEEISIAQLASAHQILDVLQPVEKRKGQRGLLALGGVDYGPGAAYPGLPGTVPEVHRCRELFHRAFPKTPATVLFGKEATVAAVQQALTKKPPSFLHLATHGFFEPPNRVERLLKGLASREDRLTLWREQTVTLHRLPLLRCGLALAGANQPPSADDLKAPSGILTGEDVKGLDLRGCELAVLSACQTALGDLVYSQGVLGLQRAFHAAGARTLVGSLWSVNDAATLVLMEEFYSRLWGKEKLSKLEALRQAQLAVLRAPERVQKRAAVLLADSRKRGVSEDLLRGVGKKALLLPEGRKGTTNRRSPEVWWAAFVLSGDWR
jgi:CHAT domain-containing protein